ncbi:MAG: MmcB family DNA repair protein [Defluviicoccus sp.]
MNMQRPATCSAPRLVDRGPHRGTAKLLIELGYRVLGEFHLANGRRADVIGIDDRAGFVIAEVKSSLADYRADGKWPAYVGYCDHFYFAVGPGFPVDVLPADVGIIIADGYAGTILRPAPLKALAAARRKALLVRFARTASSRLVAVTDEALLAAEPSP